MTASDSVARFDVPMQDLRARAARKPWRGRRAARKRIARALGWPPGRALLAAVVTVSLLSTCTMAQVPPVRTGIAPPASDTLSPTPAARDAQVYHVER